MSEHPSQAYSPATQVPISQVECCCPGVLLDSAYVALSTRAGTQRSVVWGVRQVYGAHLDESTLAIPESADHHLSPFECVHTCPLNILTSDQDTCKVFVYISDTTNLVPENIEAT